MFFNGNFQPFQTLQELNLDWILTKIKDMLRFLPDDGAAGQILRRTSSGAEWSDETSGGAVDSVNGQTGTVVLDASDIGLGNVDNVQQYSASNPPPYPVTAVNNRTGGSIVTWLPYYVCNTGAAMVNKYAEVYNGLPSFALVAGTSIIVKFNYNNTAANPTLALDNDTTLGQYPIRQYGSTAASTSDATTGWYAGSSVILTFDGSAWIMNKGVNTNTTYTICEVVCATSASTAAKTATATYFTLTNRGSFVFPITFRYANSKAAALTLNIASTGAKPLYINGALSSASNYTLPAGKYMCTYNSTYDCYMLYTTNYIVTNIIGKALYNYSDTNPPPYPVTSVNTQTGAVVLDKTSVGLGNVDNVQQYSTSNPPPYPVTSVNGQTGAVTISTSGVSVTDIWTNNSPSSGLASGTLYSGDLTQYDLLSVTFIGNSNSLSDNREVLFFYPDGTNYNMATHNVTTGTVYLFIRSITADATALTVSAGYRNNSTGNNYSVPIAVRGYNF